MSGLVFDIQKFAIHDGPGIRTTVFMKGCPLRCAWCHNPESQVGTPELSFLPRRCIGCGYCFRVCPQGAHQTEASGHVLRREKCDVCGRCAKECYAQGIEVIGKRMTVAEALADVLKDKVFYDNSGGGMTLSGGEPLLQFEFTLNLLAAAREEKLHTCIETSGYADYDRLAALLPLVDLWLYDVKETDAQRHKACTGVSNRRILANLRRLHDSGARLRLRLPLIPGVNATEVHLRACGELARSLPRLEGVEVMPYHALGLSKVERMGYAPEPAAAEIASPTAAQIEDWLAVLHNAGAGQAKRG